MAFLGNHLGIRIDIPGMRAENLSLLRQAIGVISLTDTAISLFSKTPWTIIPGLLFQAFMREANRSREQEMMRQEIVNILYKPA